MKRVLSAAVAASFALILALPSFAADPKAPAKPAAPPVAEKKAEAAKPAAKAELIDINTATEEQLKSIAGVGDAYSKKIIAGRPYAKKDQLKSKKIIPADVYEKIKDKIIAKQPKK
jgi:DNA uptake protein ComE-like DNA-binding protein